LSYLFNGLPWNPPLLNRATASQSLFCKKIKSIEKNFFSKILDTPIKFIEKYINNILTKASKIYYFIMAITNIS